MIRNSTHFQSEWIESWRSYYPGCHVVKIPDAIKSAASRFIPPKPYDIYVMVDHAFLAMELKLKTRLGGFSFKEVTEWQVNNLLEAKNNGAISYVVINYRASVTERQQKKYGLQGKRFNAVFVIEIDNFNYFDKNLPSKSIPFEWFLDNENCIRLDWIDGHWNVPMLV